MKQTLHIGPKSWVVELASTVAARVEGLGGRESLPPGEGMLFDMGVEQPLLMVTTHPMLFPIDVVFLNSKKEVESILSNVPPGMVVSGRGRYFLEVNAGEASDDALLVEKAEF